MNKNANTVTIEILVEADTASEAEATVRDIFWEPLKNVRSTRPPKAELWTLGDSRED